MCLSLFDFLCCTKFIRQTGSIHSVQIHMWSQNISLSMARFNHCTGLHSPVLELSYLPASYRGWTRAGEKRVQDNLHAHAQNKPIKNYWVPTFSTDDTRARVKNAVRMRIFPASGAFSTPELFSFAPSVMRKREELWGREWLPALICHWNYTR